MRNTIVLLGLALVLSCTKEESQDPSLISSASVSKTRMVLTEHKVEGGFGRIFHYTDGRLFKITNYYGMDEFLKYMEGERKVVYTRPGNLVTEYIYNEKGQLVSSQDQDPIRVEFRYYYDKDHLVERSFRYSGGADYEMYHTYFSYQGQRMSKVFENRKTYVNNVPVQETGNQLLYTIQWQSPFRVSIKSGDGRSIETSNFSTTIKDPFSFIPFVNYTHLFQKEYNKNENFWNDPSLPTVYEVLNQTGMLKLESSSEVRTCDGCAIQKRGMYLKNIVLNNAKLPVEYIQVNWFGLEDGSIGTYEWKINFKYQNL